MKYGQEHKIVAKIQPMVTPGWNPKGYINNAMPRISLYVV